MNNINSGGRSGPEALSARPEPREPRAEPRTPAPAPRAVEAKAPEPRPEPRPVDARPTEARAVESRSHDVRTAEHRSHEVRAHDAAPRASVLGATLRFRGELSAQEDLIVQGHVEGSITHTQSLTIGTEGSMKGEIRARVIIIDGKVDGDLYATESISVRASARVKGNIFAPRIALSEGSFFQGQVEMQASGAAVQEHSARLRQAALATPSSDGAVADKILSSGT